MALMLQLMLLLAILAVVTALILLTGIILLFWRRTRPFGLYTLLVEPGAVAGLVIGEFIWWEFIRLIHPLLNPSQQLPDWTAWILVAVAVTWLGITALCGALSGFALATWLWWRYSPEPYRSKLVAAYKKFVTMQPIFRQRWSQHRDEISGDLNE